jgi:hypothetical protein
MADPNTPATPASTPAATPAATPASTPAATPSAAATPAATPASTPAATPAATDWRKDIAGENAEHLKTLERFASPKAMFESYTALRAKMSSGELKEAKPFPDKGTPEEQNAWRKEQGLPEKPEGYYEHLKFDDGLVIGEADKPGVDAFLKSAHAANYTPAQAKAAVAWYFEQQDAAAEARAAEDAKIAQTVQDKLRAEWGGDYRTNMNGIKALLSTAPAGVADKVMNTRMADGTPLMSDPDYLRFMTSLYRQINPVSTVVPAGDEAAMAKSIDDEIAQIRDVMRTNRSKYNGDAKMQARYRDLLSAQERMGGKKAA